MNKGPLALRTISETAELVGVQQHVLRFWEGKFPFIRPTKRAGGRRFYRPQDVDLLLGVKALLYDRGYTIRGVQKLFKEEGQKAILDLIHADQIKGGGSLPDETQPDESPIVSDEDFLPKTTPVAAEESRAPAQATQQADSDLGAFPGGAATVSQDVREKFLNIAKALEEAQAALGRHLGR